MNRRTPVTIPIRSVCIQIGMFFSKKAVNNTPNVVADDSIMDLKCDLCLSVGSVLTKVNVNIVIDRSVP